MLLSILDIKLVSVISVLSGSAWGGGLRLGLRESSQAAPGITSGLATAVEAHCAGWRERRSAARPATRSTLCEPLGRPPPPLCYVQTDLPSLIRTLPSSFWREGFSRQEGGDSRLPKVSGWQLFVSSPPSLPPSQVLWPYRVFIAEPCCFSGLLWARSHLYILLQQCWAANILQTHRAASHLPETPSPCPSHPFLGAPVEPFACLFSSSTYTYQNNAFLPSRPGAYKV